MKKSFLIAGGVVIVAVIAAVVVYVFFRMRSTSSSRAAQASAQSVMPWAQPGNSTFASIMRLEVGTLLLEGTDLAVTQEQATELLPLWQMLQTLQESTTAATSEIDAVVAQIQESMTPEQLQAIRDVSATREEMSKLMQSLGIAPRSATGQGRDASEGLAARPSFPPGQGQQPGQPFSQADPAAIRATRAAQGGGTDRMASGVILEKLIELLQERANSQE